MKVITESLQVAAEPLDPSDTSRKHPAQIAKLLGEFVEEHKSALLKRKDLSLQWTSFYGLLLGTAYSLSSSYRRLAVDRVEFLPSDQYLEQIRLTLHEQLPAVAEKGEEVAFASELVGLNINTAQHLLHILLDRMLNYLLLWSFRDKPGQLESIFYYPLGLRISLIRWRLANEADVGRELECLDRAFSGWLKYYQSGSCNSFVEMILNNPEVRRNGKGEVSLEALENDIRFSIGNQAGDVRGSIAFVVDRTNEAKHLPQGTGRAQLAFKVGNATGVHQLYSTEWVLSFLAFKHMVCLARTVLRYVLKQAASVHPGENTGPRSDLW